MCLRHAVHRGACLGVRVKPGPRCYEAPHLEVGCSQQRSGYRSEPVKCRVRTDAACMHALVAGRSRIPRQGQVRPPAAGRTPPRRQESS